MNVTIVDYNSGNISSVINSFKEVAKDKVNIEVTSDLKKIKFSDILSWGDDYQLLFTSFKKNRKKLLSLAERNKVKISLVGSIVNKNGIYDDSLRPIINTNSFDHFC